MGTTTPASYFTFHRDFFDAYFIFQFPMIFLQVYSTQSCVPSTQGPSLPGCRHDKFITRVMLKFLGLPEIIMCHQTTSGRVLLLQSIPHPDLELGTIDRCLAQHTCLQVRRVPRAGESRPRGPGAHTQLLALYRDGVSTRTKTHVPLCPQVYSKDVAGPPGGNGTT